ncbi:MAG: hypothetical protein JSR19_09490 [Proteobacteria bacterium]|nr:hypothetical protein [Pseudomonadota bacterium]HQR04114.1 TAXI family TRAP transporter solute-binding subunit [Rhodocyclaceae bacterium]
MSDTPPISTPGARKRRLLLRIRHASLRDLLLIGLPALVLVGAAFWITAQFVQPAPPRHLVLATGPAGSGYQHYAAAYKPLLAAEGFDLVARPTSGTIENLALLRDPRHPVDAAFIQGGVSVAEEDGDLFSLGTLYRTPIWIFYRNDRFALAPQGLDQLRGKRLAIGEEGSGTRHLALELLASNGIGANDAVLLDAGEMAAASLLQAGKADAVILTGPERTAAIWTLLYTPGVKIMDIAETAAYARQFGNLKPLLLPRGSIDLVHNIPDHNIRMLAPAVTLAVRSDTHPALVDLLIQAAAAVHGGHGLFQDAGEFPQAKAVDFPLSPRAARYYQSGKPFLQRYLPFSLANLLDRLLVLLIPLLAVLFPIARFAPGLYGWRIRSRIFQRYGELKFIEAEAQANHDAARRQSLLQRLDIIERDVARIPTPLAFSDMLYTLRGHIGIVRKALQRPQD